MGLSGQEHQSGLPFPPPGDLPNGGTEHASPALAGRFFTAEPSAVKGSSLSLKIVYNLIVDEPLLSLHESSISPHKPFAFSQRLCCKEYDETLHPFGSQCPQVQGKSWMNTWSPGHYLDYRKLLEERNSMRQDQPTVFRNLEGKWKRQSLFSFPTKIISRTNKVEFIRKQLFDLTV